MIGLVATFEAYSTSNVAKQPTIEIRTMVLKKMRLLMALASL